MMPWPGEAHPVESSYKDAPSLKIAVVSGTTSEYSKTEVSQVRVNEFSNVALNLRKGERKKLKINRN